MERINGKTFNKINSEFYLGYLTREQFVNLPSTLNISLYDEEVSFHDIDFIVLYDKRKVIDYLDYSDEEECYKFKVDLNISPEFYMRSLELNVEEEDNGS